MYIRGLIIAPRPPRAQTTALKKKKKKRRNSPLRSKPPYKPPNRTPLPPPSRVTIRKNPLLRQRILRKHGRKGDPTSPWTQAGRKGDTNIRGERSSKLE